MPWLSVKLTPGVNSELTPTGVQAGYVSTTLGRFKAGLFQKIGGWRKFLNYLVSGVPKALHAWQAINGTQYLAVGTTQNLDVFTGMFSNGVLSSSSHLTITPQTLISDTLPSFTTASGSNIVTVTDANVNTITPYCSVYFNTPVTVDGIILSGLYHVEQNTGTTSYTIKASQTGIAGVTNGGAVPAFTSTSGSSQVKVTFANHGLSAGGDIVFPIATTVGGITIQGRYVVQYVIDASNFYIYSAAQASSSAGPVSMAAGKAELIYYIAQGPRPTSAPYGTGAYGSKGYGIGTVLPGQKGTPMTVTDWTLGNWGEDLIACQENGPIFYWPPNQGVQGAQPLPGGPPFSSGAFVSTAQQIIIAYGSSVQASIGVYQSPLLVRWCDIQDFTDWTPTPANQAGDFIIPTGSRIVAGTATPATNLIWTDIELWGMSYIGSQFVFSFVRMGSNCGIIGKHAFTLLAGNVYWIGRNNLFSLSGATVSIMPCPVWDAIFQDLDTANASSCWCGSNTPYSEVLFAYPSLQDGLGYPSRYVKFNTVENSWDIGQLQRNCWVDQSVFGPPLACDNNGTIYAHEIGNDADLVPMNSGFSTGYFYVDEGRQFTFIDRIIPDFKWGNYGGTQNATIQIVINAVNYPGDTPRTYGPFTVTNANEFITCRIRARQLQVTVQSSDSGSFWRLGNLRVRYSVDGRRG